LYLVGAMASTHTLITMRRCETPRRRRRVNGTRQSTPKSIQSGAHKETS